jgi:hypothetical protein
LAAALNVPCNPLIALPNFWTARPGAVPNDNGMFGWLPMFKPTCGSVVGMRGIDYPIFSVEPKPPPPRPFSPDSMPLAAPIIPAWRCVFASYSYCLALFSCAVARLSALT